MGRPGRIWWRASCAEWYATIDGRKVRLGKDRDAAQREFHRLKSLRDPVKLDTMSVIELVGRYLEAARKRVKPITWERYQYALQLWVERYGAMRAAELRPFHLSRWLESFPAWGKSTRALQGSIVKAWSAWSFAEGYLDVDRLAGARLPSIGKRDPVPSGNLDKLLAAAESQEFRDVLTFLLDTGCRPGEARSLEATRIDCKRSTAVVVGKMGQRTIGLSRRVVAILARLRAQWQDGPIFRTVLGRAWTQDSLKRYFDRASNRADIPRVTPYHCRHAWWERAGGASDVLKAKQLGHVSLKQMVARYAHPSPAQLADVSEAASQHGQAGQQPKSRPRKVGKNRTKRAPRRGRKT